MTDHGNIDSTPGPGRKRPAFSSVGVILALLTLLQAVLAVSSFRSWDDLANPRPLVNTDFASQYYWSYAAREFFKADGRLWGYDPNFMAGYPLSFIFNSSLPIQLTAVAIRGAELGTVIKFWFLVSFALAPLGLYLSLRAFGLRPGPAIAAGALGVALFWAGEDAWFGHMGMVSGACLLWFYLLPVSLLHRFTRHRDLGSYLSLLVVLPAAFTLHKTAFVLVPPLALILIAVQAGRLGKREWAMLLGLFIWTALVNLHWLLPFARFLPLKIEDPATTFFQNLDPLKPLADLWPLPPQPFIALPLCRLAILCAGVLGLARLRRTDRACFLALMAGLVFLGGFSYFGSRAPQLRHLQPYRHVTAYFYLWLPAAGVGLAELGRRLERWPLAARTAPLGLALAIGLSLFLPSFRFFCHGPNAPAALTTELDGPSASLVEWARDHVDRSARFLIEDINVWDETTGPIYGGARVPQLFPLLADVEVVGGPLPNAFIRHHRVSLEDGRLLGRPIASFSDAELAASLELYNLGWAACWSAESKRRLAAYPGARRAARRGYLEVFVFDRGHGFFLEGEGAVNAGFNRVRLTGLTTKTGRVVISYHWVPGLRTVPEVKLTKVAWGDDPVGFIGLVNPPREVELRLGPGGD